LRCMYLFELSTESTALLQIFQKYKNEKKK